MYGTVRSLALIRWAGFAAAVGGALVAVKGIAIVVTGDQPEYIFEVAPLFLALGLGGLHALLEGRGRRARAGGRGARPGRRRVGGGQRRLLRSDDRRRGRSAERHHPADGALDLRRPLLGIAVRRTDALPGRWRSFPLAIRAGVLPLMMVGGVLEALSERLLEVPLVVLGLAWIALGYAIWSHAPGTPAETAFTQA